MSIARLYLVLASGEVGVWPARRPGEDAQVPSRRKDEDVVPEGRDNEAVRRFDEAVPDAGAAFFVSTLQAARPHSKKGRNG